MMNPENSTPQPDNPIIRHKFTTDPTVLVHDDTVYLCTGHDEAPAGVENYLMNEWLRFSSTDLVNWTEHPMPFFRPLRGSHSA